MCLHDTSYLFLAAAIIAYASNSFKYSLPSSPNFYDKLRYFLTRYGTALVSSPHKKCRSLPAFLVFMNNGLLWHFRHCGIIYTVVAPSLATEGGGVHLNILISFLVSVVAGVVSYYICKWLDGDDSDN